MSNMTFNMSTKDQMETTAPLPPRSLQLSLSSDSHYGDVSLTSSPDSMGSISITSEASSSPDINMPESRFSKRSLADSRYKTTSLQGELFCDGGMNLNQTFIATPPNNSMDFCNENLSLVNSQGTASEKYQTFSQKAEDERNVIMASPDSAGVDSRPPSSETSRRGSTENDLCSISSGEMVIRSNSFCLEDQSLLVVSSLEESFISPGHPALSAESNILSPTLPDVCGKSTERVNGEITGSLCLGMTFTMSENCEFPIEEIDVLPSENKGALQMTFVCETTSDSGKVVQFASGDSELLPHFPGAFTPEQGKSFVSTLSGLQSNDKDIIHTSTPVQNIENKIPGIPSFSESPCTGNAESSGSLHGKKQQTPITQKQRLVAGLFPSASKIKKMEIKKLPKSGLSNVKPKVVTRTVHQMVVSSPAPQHKPSHVNVPCKSTEAQRRASIKIVPANARSSTTVVSASAKRDNAQKQVNRGASCLGLTVTQSSERTVLDGQCKNRASPAANTHASAAQCSNASSETEQMASGQISDSSAQCTGTRTVCFSSSEKSSDKSGQTDPKPTPKKCVSNKIEVRSGSALGQDKPPLLRNRPRCTLEKKTTVRLPTDFTFPKNNIHLGQTKSGNLNTSSQIKPTTRVEATKRPAENSPREVKKISLLIESKKAPETSLDDSKSRVRGQPSPRRGAPLSQPPVASSRPATLSTRQKQGTFGKDEFRLSKGVVTPQSKQKSTPADSQRALATGDPSCGTVSTAGIKPQLSGSRPAQTPIRLSLMGHSATPACRLPCKTSGPSRSQTEHRVQSERSESPGSTKVSGGVACKPSPFKTALKARLIPTPGKNTKPTLPTTCKPAASTGKGTSNSTVSPLQRTASSRQVCLSSRGLVDKNKPKATFREQQSQPQPSQSNHSHGPVDVTPPTVTEGERKDQRNQQLKGLLATANSKFEAIVVVLQQTLSQRDESTRQCRELSQELVNLRGELVCSVHLSERLEKEKEEARVALENVLQELQVQHRRDLDELEQRLQAFYQAEWDKVHLTYQEEADKCKNLMQQQVGELEANHEAMKLKLESSHVEQLQCVKQQYEKSLEELRKIHTQELESLDKTLKDAEAALSGQIQELTEENSALIEKLTAEESRRRELAEKSQKDPHSVYLEQELESLKVVLDIKNKQLHQQEKKLMEIDKLTEKNVKLDESLKKVQQENEDLKARMERHAALSRQLSTEQAMLQESLQKESKVNKRLSMENEELLWKLHNGDLSSPSKVSPTSTSPSHSFSLQSPRSSGVFSSHSVSPR